MNDAHLHLIVNHFPIIGTFFGIGILITGIIMKNNSVKNTAYVLLIIATLFGAFSMKTGEGAEELVENFPSIGHEIIHEHEELAEKFMLFLYATGAVAGLALVLSYRKHKWALNASYVTLVLALISGVLAKSVGTSGGEIRHTEIRTNNQEASTVQEAEENHSEND